MIKKDKWKRGISLFLAFCFVSPACTTVMAAEGISAVRTQGITEATKSLEAAEVPRVTKSLKAAEASKAAQSLKATQAAKVTEAPKVAESLKVAEAPKVTEVPKMTKVPKVMEGLKVTEVPKVTGGLKETKVTQKPKVTVTPKVTSTPVSEAAAIVTPTYTPTPTPMPEEEESGKLEEKELCAVIDAMTKGEGIQKLNTEYEPDEKLERRLNTVIQRIEKQGQKLSFLMLDLNTGAAFFYNPQENLFSASTIKGPYIACVTENVLDTGETTKDEVLFTRSDYGDSVGTGIMKLDSPDTQYTFEEMLSKTIQYSDDVGYAMLRQRFGVEDFRKWLEEAGVEPSLADYSYPMYTIRELGKMWLHMDTYFDEGENGAWLRELYTRSESSVIRLELGDKYEVFTKPGFNETPDGDPVSNALDDAGIVNDEENPYLLAIMTDGKGWDNASQSGDTPEVKANIRRLRTLTSRLDELHDELVLWQKEQLKGGNEDEISNGT